MFSSLLSGAELVSSQEKAVVTEWFAGSLSLALWMGYVLIRILFKAVRFEA